MNYWIRFVALVSLTLLTLHADAFDAFIFENIKRHPVVPSLQLRNSNNNLAVCNEKYVYMRYLIGIRNFKRVYRIVKDNHFADIQNAINILNILNLGYPNDAVGRTRLASSLFHANNFFKKYKKIKTKVNQGVT